MNSNLLFSLISGGCFAFWPVFMNRSGMTGILSSFVFSLMCAVGTLPFAIYGGLGAVGVRWGCVAVAGTLGTLGMLTFNNMLANTTKTSVGTYFLITIIFQTMLVALTAIGQNGWTVSWQKGCGLALALAAVYLLTK